MEANGWAALQGAPFEMLEPYAAAFDAPLA